MKRYTATTQQQQIVPADCAERIKALRAKYNLTQMRLADLLGVSFASVSRWENGNAWPPTATWHRIARAEQYGLEALSQRVGIGESAGGASHIHETADAYATDTASDASAVPTFTAAPDVVRLAVEAHRLEYGYLVNPAFATEVSLIEPLPHQRIAVYERMLPQSRQDDHDRPLRARDAGPPAVAPRAHRPARRLGRQLAP